MDRIRSAVLAHIQAIVDDIDEASAFCREVTSLHQTRQFGMPQ